MPFSTPPNALVMNPSREPFMDYIRVGLPLQIVMGIVMVFALPIISLSFYLLLHLKYV